MHSSCACTKTVYDVYSSTRRRTLLWLVAAGKRSVTTTALQTRKCVSPHLDAHCHVLPAVYPLLPLSDTILLTSMPTIAAELGASSAAITATMSLYLLAAGVGFALWGPISGLCAWVDVGELKCLSVRAAHTSLSALTLFAGNRLSTDPPSCVLSTCCCTLCCTMQTWWAGCGCIMLL